MICPNCGSEMGSGGCVNNVCPSRTFVVGRAAPASRPVESSMGGILDMVGKLLENQARLIDLLERRVAKLEAEDERRRKSPSAWLREMGFPEPSEREKQVCLDHNLMVGEIKP